jgi:hypothetical protein
MTLDDFFERLEKASKQALEETARVELGAIAVRFRDDLEKAVREQRYPMPDLSKAWLNKKRRHNLDLRKLIASGEYLRGIKARRFDKMSWIVEPSDARVKKYKFQKKQPKITYKKLAEVHEYGLKNEEGKQVIKPRPHWTPTIDKYKKDSRRLGKEVQAAFARRLNRRMRRFFQAA